MTNGKSKTVGSNYPPPPKKKPTCWFVSDQEFTSAYVINFACLRYLIKEVSEIYSYDSK